MSQLSYNVRDVDCPDGKKATVVELDGSVDPSSLDDFDAIFDQLLENGSIRVIINLGKLKYINSTGMGMMVQYYDQLSDEGGGLVLLAVNAKVTLVLEMLGLQELFPIVANEKEAIAALMGESVTPASVQVKLEESDHPQAQTPRINLTVTCGSCGAELLTGGAGAYLCPRCRAALAVDSSGSVRTCAPSGDDSVEISVPAEAAFFKSAAALLARLGIKAGLSDSEVVSAASSIQSTLAKISELCFTSEQAPLHRLQLAGNSTSEAFEVYIYCAGRTISDSSGFDESASAFDVVDYLPVNGGNLLKLSKRVS